MSKAAKLWIHNRPEDRLQIAVFRFLNRTLLPPRYIAFLSDSDHGNRTDLQRIRDANRGRIAGQLDGDVIQGNPPIARKLELKHGRNKPTERQRVTIDTLTQCGFPPIIAWSLAEVHEGLAAAGFRFAGNALVVRRHMEEVLAGWDREAEAIMSGEVVRKTSRARRPEMKKHSLNWILPG